MDWIWDFSWVLENKSSLNLLCFQFMQREGYFLKIYQVFIFFLVIYRLLGIFKIARVLCNRCYYFKFQVILRWIRILIIRVLILIIRILIIADSFVSFFFHVSLRRLTFMESSLEWNYAISTGRIFSCWLLNNSLYERVCI